MATATCPLRAGRFPPLSPFRSLNHSLVLRLGFFLPDPLARSPFVPGAVAGVGLTGRSPAAANPPARSPASPPIAYPKGVWTGGWRGRSVDVTLVTLFRHGDGEGARCHGRRGLKPSEVPRFVGKLIFLLSLGSQSVPRELDNIVLACTSNKLVQNVVFQFF